MDGLPSNFRIQAYSVDMVALINITRMVGFSSAWMPASTGCDSDSKVSVVADTTVDFPS
jgi:hypothetical protein